MRRPEPAHRGSYAEPHARPRRGKFRAPQWDHVVSLCRGGPISAGWNSTAAAIVHTRASAISLPMLDVPGWLDSHKLPNAVAVVSALKITARVRLDCSSAVFPRRHAMM